MSGWTEALIYGYRRIYEAGVELANRSKLNFSAGFVVEDNPTTGMTDVSVAAGAGGGYQTVDADGTPVTQRTELDFSDDFDVSDVGGKTRVAISASGSEFTLTTNDASVHTLATIALDDDTQTDVDAIISGRATGSDDGARFNVSISYLRRSGGSPVALGTLSNLDARSTAGATAYAVTASVSGNNLLLRVQEPGGQTVNWHAKVQTIKAT